MYVAPQSPGRRSLAVQVTWRCDFSCDHCIQRHIKRDVDLDRVRSVALRLHELGVIDRVGLTGGEPTLRLAAMTPLIRELRQRGLSLAMVTNGGWARRSDGGASVLAELSTAGVGHLTFSVDDYHARFVDSPRLLAAIRAATDVMEIVSVFVSLGSGPSRRATEDLASQVSAIPAVRVYRREIVHAGASHCEPDSSRSVPVTELGHRCPDENIFTLYPDGAVLPCCSAGAHPNLAFADLEQCDAEELLVREASDPVTRLLRTGGPKALLYAMMRDGIEPIGAQQRFMSTCDMCHAVARSAEGIALVRSRGVVSEAAAVDVFDRLFFDARLT